LHSICCHLALSDSRAHPLASFISCAPFSRAQSTLLARASAAKCARLRQAFTARISEVKCSVGAGVQRYAARPLTVLVWSLQQVASISSQGKPHSTTSTIQVPLPRPRPSPYPASSRRDAVASVLCRLRERPCVSVMLISPYKSFRVDFNQVDFFFTCGVSWVGSGEWGGSRGRERKGK
jgi:hypothetical protein